MLFKIPIRPLEPVRVLRHPSFARFFVSQLVEDSPDSFYLVALPWLVLQLGGSAADLGLTGAMATVPFLIVSPVAGVIVDRLNRALVLIASNVIRAVALLAILLVGGIIGLEPWHLSAAAFLLTTADVAAFTAREAVTPNLVPREDLVAANTLGIAGRQLVGIGGKAAAGFLLFAIGSFGTIGASIVLYVISMVLLFTIRRAVAPPARSVLPVRDGKKIGHIVTDLADAVQFMVKHPVLRALAIGGAVINGAQFPLLGLLLAVLFENVLEAGPRAFGLFLSVSSLGVLVAMLIAPKVARQVGEGRLAVVSLAVWGVSLGLLAVVTDVWQALILGALLGVIGGGLVPLGAFTQSEVPDEMRGRIGGTMMAANLALVPVTFLLAGWLMDAVGPRPLYALAGLIVAACALGLLSERPVREARLVSPETTLPLNISLCLPNRFQARGEAF
jgi:MFS family permease